MARTPRPDGTPAMSDSPPTTGAAIIRSFVRTLPASPGVYRMIDEAGEVIYVGKARSLKGRVTNYTRPEGLPVRTQRMIAATRSMEFVRTGTESEALLQRLPPLLPRLRRSRPRNRQPRRKPPRWLRLSWSGTALTSLTRCSRQRCASWWVAVVSRSATAM